MTKKRQTQAGAEGRHCGGPPPTGASGSGTHSSAGRPGARRRLWRSWWAIPAAFLLLILVVLALRPWNRGTAPAPPGGPALGALPLGALPPGTPILFITIDTLREDHLSRSGYPRETTPFLDRLAGEGIYFARCFSQCSWTLPSMLTLISSLSPPVFGIRDGIAPIPREGEETQPENPHMQMEIFAQAHVTLAEALRAHGYRTIGVSTNGHLIERQGFTQGFDSFNETDCMWGKADCALARALEVVDAQPLDSLFLWVHLFDPHFDQYGRPPVYLPAPGYETLFGKVDARDQAASVIADYDRKIRYTDDQLRAFCGALEQRGLLDRFLIVIAADHGEEFNEKGRWGHSKSLTNTLIHVPLIVRLPEKQAGGRVVADVVRNLDVMPTILDLVGAPIPSGVEGVSLRPALEGRSLPPLTVYAETRRTGLFMIALIDPALDRKVVMDFRTQSLELYAFTEDVREGTNLAGGRAQEARQLAERLKGFAQEMEQRAIIETAPGTLSEEERERLRSLGYLGGG
ncbi:MAG: sulfatase [Candidatus Eisenbacteria bacterium]